MNKINYRRIRLIRDDMYDCLVKLDRVTNVIINSKDEFIIEDYTSAFRYYLVSYRELLFSCVSHLCKTLGVLPSSGKVIDCTYKCVDAGYFSVDNREFYKTLNSYRVSASHRYNQPTTRELIEFYNTYKIQLHQIASDLDNILSKSNKDSLSNTFNK